MNYSVKICKRYSLITGRHRNEGGVKIAEVLVLQVATTGTANQSIFDFPFLIFHFSSEKWINLVSSMKNGKSKMENQKCFDPIGFLFAQSSYN
jgi:hypothetical protein